MKTNQYKRKTKVLGIPVPGPGDRIISDIEMRKWTIVENLLLGAMRHLKNCIFEEGELTVRREVAGDFSVLLSATGRHHSLTGLVGSMYFEAPPVVIWEKVPDKMVSYLYVRPRRETCHDPSAIRAVVSDMPLKDLDAVLVAVADLRDENAIKIDRNPDGKIVSRDIGEHILGWDNPHGDTLVQDNVVVKKQLIIDEGASVKGLVRVVEVVTAGQEGVRIEGDVKFALVSPSSSKVGKCWVKYDDKGVVVCNDGDVGEIVRVLVV